MWYHTEQRADAMTRLEKLYMRVASSPTNTRFEDVVRLAEAVGFVLVRQRGSHYMFFHPELPHLRLNIQPIRGQAKAYQVKDLLAGIEQNGPWRR